MRHRLPDAERIADRQHEIADLQRIGIAELDRLQIVGRRFELEDRKVGARILQHDLGLELAPVRQRDLHLGRALDHVVVGDDEPAAVRDDAGAERALHLLALHAAEEAPEDRVVEHRVAVFDNARRIDVDDRRRGPLHGRSERKF